MRLHVLCLGHLQVDRGRILTPGIGDGEQIVIPIPAYLIETGEQRVLIDTGMNAVHVVDPEHTFRDTELADALLPMMTAEDTVEQRLANIGLTTAEVTHVVNSHLHFDHCGQNGSFAGRPIIVQREQYEAALGETTCPNENFDLPELTYELIEGERELFPGVRCILSPGHMPGHQSFLVDLPNSGRILLSIDAIYCADNVEHDAWGSQMDPDAARASARRLQQIAERERARLVYGHDRAQWASLRPSPQFYD